MESFSGRELRLRYNLWRHKFWTVCDRQVLKKDSDLIRQDESNGALINPLKSEKDVNRTTSERAANDFLS